MQTTIKPSATIRQNYNEIATLCKETQEPVSLTRNDEGDLVVMGIAVYDQGEKQLELQRRLVEVEELRRSGVEDISAHSASQMPRKKLMEEYDVSS